MTSSSNPYVQQLLEQGKEPSKAPSRFQRTFPCTIGARYFATKEEYDRALGEFLNGY